MSVLLEGFYSQFPAAFRKKMTACIPRECDETAPGKFVAFVDEADMSYDVSIQISGAEITAASCECGGDISKMCRHIASLIVHVQKQEKAPAAERKKRAKEKNATLTLLQQTDEEELRKWVGDLLQNNKDLELAFTHHFAAQQINYTAEEIQRVTAEALKAALGRKKKADPTEVKKLVDLLKKVYQPFLEKYHQAPYDKTGIEVFQAIIVSIEDIFGNVAMSSNRLMKFLEQTLKNAASDIQLIETDSSWQQAVLYFINNMVRNRTIRPHYLRFLEDLMEQSTAARQVTLAHLLTAHFKTIAGEHFYNETAYTKILFTYLQRLTLTPQYLNLFVPIRFELNFNIALISELIKTGNLPDAEKHAIAQINANAREEYDLPYFKLLKDIYTKTNREKDLTEVMIQMLPLTWNYEDYKWLSDKLPQDKWQAVRTKMMGMAARLMERYNRPATEFYFTLLADEGKIAKMLDKLTSMPYALIAKSYHSLYAKNKVVLLEKLLEREDYGWGMEEDWQADDATAFEQLYMLMKQTYGVEPLKLRIKQQEKSRSIWMNPLSKFGQFVKDRLEYE